MKTLLTTPCLMLLAMGGTSSSPPTESTWAIQKLTNFESIISYDELINQILKEPLCFHEPTLHSKFSGQNFSPQANHQELNDKMVYSPQQLTASDQGLPRPPKRKWHVILTEGAENQSPSKQTEIVEECPKSPAEETRSMLLEGADFDPDEIMRKNEELMRNTSDFVPHAQLDMQEEKSKEPSIPTKLFHVYNWEYVKQSPQDQTTEGNGVLNADRLEELFRLLNSCKTIPQQGPLFWIPRENVHKFLKRYRKLRLQSPGRSVHRERKRVLGKLIAELCDEKLDIEKYPIFSDEIIKSLRDRLALRLKINQTSNETRQNDNRLLRKVQTIIQYITNVTKISVFLIITHLSLFKEHQNEILSREEVNKILCFMRDLWKDMEQEELLLEPSKYTWIKRSSDMFRLEEKQDDLRNEKVWANGYSLWYFVAEDIVKYWTESNRNKFKLRWGKREYPSEISQIIELIISYANYETIVNS
ncbi:hypothetical protein PGTUg99_008922 [Puccinia graminis f. sp. tritici]|uniref:Uncharacterized protein n=2 Tax=Puccinia graminis f. sp. tritici TaxID=56615 RepID=A0A5B0RV23_PUCGR|nr:hypothetical protein PGTUg99_008922 [Puccinia graminis f. sp. tritici]